MGKSVSVGDTLPHTVVGAGGRVEVEVVTSLSQSRTAAAQCGLFTHKSVLVIFEPPCIFPHGQGLLVIEASRSHPDT